MTPIALEVTPATEMDRSSERDRVKVLIITGWGRSGSTVLSNILGELDGFFSAGEVHYLWLRGVIRRLLCACRRPVLECDVWTSVLSSPALTDAMRGLDAEQVVAIQRDAVRMKNLRRVLGVRAGQPSGWRELDDYRRVLNATYIAISAETGARVIVDSSKRPINAALLRLLEDVDPYVVHLVRDPRAVAFSRRRLKMAFGRRMKQTGASQSTIKWVHRNLKAEAVRRRFPDDRSLLVRYEDFVAHPEASVKAIVALVGEEPRSWPFVHPNVVQLEPNHAVSGNQSRYRSGPIEIRADEEWRHEQKLTDRLIATACALPLLKRYGYRVRPAIARRRVQMERSS